MFSNIKKSISVGKKIFIVLIVYIVIFGLFAKFSNSNQLFSKADSVKYNRNKMYARMNDKELNKTKRGKISLAVAQIVTCISIGETCSKNPNEGDKYYSQSLLGMSGKLLAIPFTNPPASGIGWLQDSFAKTGFIPKTYAAAGIGFATIRPFITLWTALRDVAYLALVLIIVAIGFMIMFRMKLNPQTVISVENSLPNIVVSLILITFSFAIAGFLIDLMYLLIVILVSVIGKVSGGNIASLTSSYIQAAPLDIIDKVLGGQGIGGNFFNLFKLPTSLLALAGDGIHKLIQLVATTLIGFIWTIPFFIQHFVSPLITQVFPDADVQPAGVGFTWGIIKAVFDFPVKVVFGIGGGLALAFVLFNLILMLLILISVLYIFFRIFFMMLASYIKIIILVVLAPVLLMFNAIPGRNVFSAWFMNLFSELLIFPIVIAIFLLGGYIAQIPMTNTALLTPPFFYGVNPETLSFLLGMGLLFMTPDLVEVAKKLINPKPLPLPDVGPGVFFGGVSTGVSSGLGEVSKYASFGYYFSPLGNLLKKIPGLNVAAPHGSH